MNFKKDYTLKSLITIFLFLITLISHLQAQDTEEEIKKVAEQIKGHVGAGLYVIETNKSAWFNRNDQFPMQSVYKFPIGMAVLAKVDEGLIGLDEMVTVHKSELIGPAQHSPIRDKHPEGNFTISIRDLLYYAVSESDGSASDVLMRCAGGSQEVMRFLKKIGITGMLILNTELEIGRDDSVQYKNCTDPESAIKLLHAFYDGKILKDSSRALLMKLMTETKTGPNRLKGLLPANASVAHKTGTSGTKNGNTAATNDIGIITLPNGKHLLAAVFVSDSPESASVRESVIARIAKIGWDKFSD